MTSYQDKLRHPKWQKTRLRLLDAADWRCSICKTDEKELHVHHLSYQRNKDPWDYPDKNFLVVCKDCHGNVLHDQQGLAKYLPDLSGYYVVDFHYIDDFRANRPLHVAFDFQFDEEPTDDRFRDVLTSQLETKLHKLFSSHGWEGDGTIDCLVIPPCFIANGDNICEIAFHVKQSNNGTSFLALPKHVTFALPEGFLCPNPFLRKS